MATIIFLCDGEQYPAIRQDIKDAQKDFSKGNFYEIDWSHGNVKNIQVEDRAYLQRVGGHSPHGYFAAGHVIAAPKSRQLRLQGEEYSRLSEAYLNDGLCVLLRLDSIVDFDHPLLHSQLQKLPQFKESTDFGKAQFVLYRSGCEFNPHFSPFLDSEWEKHSLELSRRGLGSRLVDVFYDQGQKYREQKDFQAAIDSYKHALKINPNDGKVLNVKSICERLLQKSLQNPSVNPEELIKNDVETENAFSEALEDVATGGSQGLIKLEQLGKKISLDDLREAGTKAQKIGLTGECYVNFYFSTLVKEKKITRFQWSSSENPISPYDFYIELDDASKIFLDAKSTAGRFDNPIHISLNELRCMSFSERYDLYRVFEINDVTKTAKLKIVENVKCFAQNILAAFDLLSEGVLVDGISVIPSKLGLDFKAEIILHMH